MFGRAKEVLGHLPDIDEVGIVLTGTKDASVDHYYSYTELRNNIYMVLVDVISNGPKTLSQVSVLGQLLYCTPLSFSTFLGTILKAM